MKLEFSATLVNGTAIALDGQGDGGKLKLEVSREFCKQLRAMQDAAGKEIRISAEFADA